MSRPHDPEEEPQASEKGPRIVVPEELAEAIEEGEESVAPPTPPAPPAAEGDASTLQAQLDEARDKYLRLAADFENYKRRTLRERQELFQYANEGLVKELLVTVDNLDRALDYAQQSIGEDGDKTLLEGVELTRRSLWGALEKIGVAMEDPTGEPFDPNLHEAVRQVSTSAVPAGHVVEVLQKGYVLKDRLLRPALVVVSSGE
ncbi:MAG: nucleotide exchange factor GrpE [Myxococcota bacterium]